MRWKGRISFDMIIANEYSSVASVINPFSQNKIDLHCKEI